MSFGGGSNSGLKDYIYWNNLGKEYLQTKHNVKAIDCFQKAVQMAPQYASGWNNKGLALKTVGKYADAIACYREAIRLEPSFEKAWFNLASVYHQMKRHEEAIDCCDKVLQLKPGYLKASYKKGSSLLALNKPEEARECFLRVLAIDPQNVDAIRKIRELEDKSSNSLLSSTSSSKAYDSSSQLSDGMQSIRESEDDNGMTDSTTDSTSTVSASTVSSASRRKKNTSPKKLTSLPEDYLSMYKRAVGDVLDALDSMTAREIGVLTEETEQFLTRLQVKKASLTESETSSSASPPNPDLLCSVCSLKPRAMIAKPCGHIGLCRKCSKKQRTCTVCKARLAIAGGV